MASVLVNEISVAIKELLFAKKSNINHKS